MKRLGKHGSIGSSHQLPVNINSNQILGSGQNLMSDSSYQSGSLRSVRQVYFEVWIEPQRGRPKEVNKNGCSGRLEKKKTCL